MHLHELSVSLTYNKYKGHKKIQKTPKSLHITTVNYCNAKKKKASVKPVRTFAF